MAGTATPAGAGPAGNVWADAIIWGTRWDSPGDVTTISVNVAGRGGPEEVDAGPVTALDPTRAELAAIRAAMALVEEVCRIDFREVRDQRNADIVWAMVGDEDAEGNLGWATLPFGGPDDQGVIALNRDALDPAAGGDVLRPGGFDFGTPIHELGHALGLDHTHDPPTPFPGVDGPGDLGRLGMNQGAFTMMGYNDGWVSSPHGRSPSPLYGFQAGPMAIDIAALQALYGVNAATRAGDDAYRLPGANRPGTGYSCIWDAGGTDRMLGTGRADSIDLRAASLELAPGGGGWVSFAQGVHGGFTIAGGVLIEDALGGGGSDRIRGNGAANGLRGEGGDDRIRGGDGADRLRGGDGRHVLVGGDGGDTLSGGDGPDLFVFAAASQSRGAGRDAILDFRPGRDRVVVDGIDADTGLAGDQAFRLDGGGAFAAGEVRQTVAGGDLLLEFNADADARPEMAILLAGVAGPLGAGDFDL